MLNFHLCIVSNIGEETNERNIIEKRKGKFKKCELFEIKKQSGLRWSMWYS